MDLINLSQKLIGFMHSQKKKKKSQCNILNALSPILDSLLY